MQQTDINFYHYIRRPVGYNNANDRPISAYPWLSWVSDADLSSFVLSCTGTGFVAEHDSQQIQLNGMPLRICSLMYMYCEYVNVESERRCTSRHRCHIRLLKGCHILHTYNADLYALVAQCECHTVCLKSWVFPCEIQSVVLSEGCGCYRFTRSLALFLHCCS